MSREELLNEQIWALRAVLASTEAIEAALDPLDVHKFEEALAARSEALRRLEAAAGEAPVRFEGTDAPAERAALLRILRELTRAIQEAEARNRDLAEAALGALRDGLRDVRDGNRALQGYRAPPTSDARFADRRG